MKLPKNPIESHTAHTRISVARVGFFAHSRYTKRTIRNPGRTKIANEKSRLLRSFKSVTRTAITRAIREYVLVNFFTESGVFP